MQPPTTGATREVKGRRFTFIGVAIAVMLMVSFVVVTFSAYQSFLAVREAARLAACRPYLIFRASEAYALDNEGDYPPLSSDYGRFVYDVERIRPYAFPTSDHICEFDLEGPSEGSLLDADLDQVDDWSYVYLSYVIENDTQGLAFLGAYANRADGRLGFQADLTVADGEGNGGGSVLHRLRTATSFTNELEYIQKDAARIPVVIEWPGNHRSGNKVVFLDGHEEVIPYPGKFPMTETFITALRAVDTKYSKS